MTDQSSRDAAARRRFLGTGAAAVALAGTTAVPAAHAAHARAAGAYPFTRNRFHMVGDTISLPKANQVYLAPFSTLAFSDSNDVTLQADGKILINNTGLYKVSLCIDWPGQYGVDIDLRRYGISRVGTNGNVPNGRLTPITQHDDRLCEYDSVGVDSPAYGRYTGTWAPGAIAMGASATTTIAIPNTQKQGLVAGDVCIAGLSSLTDAAIGAPAVNALVLSAKVVGKDSVRITLTNPSIASGVTVPSGTLNVLGMSMTMQRGNSADSWNVITTPLEELLAGQVIYAYFLSKTPGDFIQITDQTFVQVERYA